MIKLLSTVLLFLISLQSFALAEGVYTVIVKKQEEKKSSRWSLADWLVTKKRIALMDQWLALNSSTTWFEYIFDYAAGDLDEYQENELERFGASLYLKFLGLEYSRNNFSALENKSEYKLNLLLLGSSVQSTHIRGFYGKRKDSTYSQDLYGGSLTLYIASFLGTELNYTKLKEAKSSDGLSTVEGERVEYGVFLELSFIRLYLNNFKERNSFKGAGLSPRTDEGTILGTKLFF
ncbi:hypothetical protein [Halobacteriovorax sp.]|uniref:hypothetical protein n=1 Tax=Halobacteriovorax sp. TaxID=2020862 RepID=UPI00356AD4EF